MSDLIFKFYDSFNNLDAKKMVSYYHDDIIFQDPAFGILKGERAKAMWLMLCESQKGKDFTVTFSDIKTDANKGSAHWEAMYTFSKTGRKVHNKIDAEFEFKDGLIIKHTDNFDLHKWAKQAMGFKGLLLGGTKFFRTKLQSQTNYLLDKYMAEKKLPK
ncbi:MAG: limonene-1,2-epoxide hydrolase [Flavobacteriaceae bacterium]|uniref:nuclear transport factor 2 family protein n=1 Tax=Winogradskyella sp. SYSU M77433 TaxID=3042722 RepID=UPI000C668305|nr:nuclear transport factor 2 family protein [Winogradskyella sp. SYSU M77433]MAX71619.1 limonene-1,2-epoxide hydrolase [Flavobacteriaceae bacterium]MDH7912655.1 nuclear transport factor 2 family protein [Winogradskyella sp. SYSU M77433]